MANYQIEFLPTAQKELASLPKQMQQRVAAKLEQLKADPYIPGVKALKNGGGRLRLRIGNYRIIYRIEPDRLVILVVKVGHRRDVYRE
ncbi:MAG: type II toxin-antitoxin system RelE/ParE family toxin [Cyanobacteria bacterium CRU_2_1]|nr:type II toxin-antitoxin system RelE/ParE family toxin [Cyanobacteria bacterium RU_5_0]NJR58949.1 type II toxin-antitoxin system RelE/ParE family toxin [Cyanobacteria bacterium CRU_2_1]